MPCSGSQCVTGLSVRSWAVGAFLGHPWGSIHMVPVHTCASLRIRPYLYLPENSFDVHHCFDDLLAGEEFEPVVYPGGTDIRFLPLLQPPVSIHRTVGGNSFVVVHGRLLITVCFDHGCQEGSKGAGMS